MRLWHKALIPYLPKQQLIAQWRECCAIARSISIHGNPNHILVNRIMDYPISHFQTYTQMVFTECINRGYRLNPHSFCQWINHEFEPVSDNELFKNWHDIRYFWQCYYNLEEKYFCGAIEQEEWELLCDEFCEWL